jgi:rod shape-determining protein MreC
MPEVLSRHRPLALLAALVVGQVLLLAFQIKRNSNVRLIRYWAAEIVTPGEKGASWTFGGIGHFWSSYIGLHHTYAENQRLRREVGRLELRNQELESQASEAQRLRALLDFRDAHREAPMIAAQVIGGSADPSSHTLFINRGERSGIRRNQAVITPNGIVGKIVEVSPASSQVLLINDRDSGVGALFADTRAQGIIKGTGDPQPVMAYVENDEKVHPGELILTSGDDRIFPKGLLVGTVASVKPGYPFQSIQVQTAARLDRLEDVFVLLSEHDLTPKSNGGSGDVAMGLPPMPATAPVPLNAPAASASASPEKSAPTAKPSATPAKAVPSSAAAANPAASVPPEGKRP